MQSDLMFSKRELQGFAAAFEDGWLSGMESTDCAAHCPFDHDQKICRDAWLKGFSFGRIEAANRTFTTNCSNTPQTRFKDKDGQDPDDHPG
jgi:hypothetical protein